MEFDSFNSYRKFYQKDNYARTADATGGAAEITGAGNIATAEAFGPPAVSVTIATLGIATAEAFGPPAVSVTIATLGIVTAEALGSPEVSATIATAGIATAEAHGSPAVSVTIVAAGIASEEAIGQPGMAWEGEAQEITGAGGIASEEAFGEPTVEAGTALPAPEYGGYLPWPPTPVIAQHSIRGCGGIASAEFLGQPRVALDYTDDELVLSLMMAAWQEDDELELV